MIEWRSAKDWKLVKEGQEVIFYYTITPKSGEVSFFEIGKKEGDTAIDGNYDTYGIERIKYFHILIPPLEKASAEAEPSMGSLDDMFFWWANRYKYEIALFFTPTKPNKNYHQPQGEGLTDTLLNFIDNPNAVMIEKSGILEAMIAIDFFAFFEMLKEHCQPLYAKWEKGK